MLFITLKRKCVKRKLRNRKQIIIFAYIVIAISIKYCDKIILNNCDYSFLSRFDIVLEASNNFFAYIVNENVKTIQIKNVFNKVFIVFKNLVVKELQNYNKNNCYLAYSKNLYLAIILLLK